MALMRCYSALGRQPDCARALHVCLSLCQGEEEPVYAYMCGQTALEGKGKTLFEDTWEAYVEDHPGVRNKLESMLSVSKQLEKTIESGCKKPRSWTRMWQQLELRHKAAVYLLCLMIYFSLVYVLVLRFTASPSSAAATPAFPRPMPKVPASLATAITE